MPLEPSDRAQIWDMRASCERLVAFTDGVSAQEFMANEILQLAVERLLQNIGESARRVSSSARTDSPSIPWVAIVGQRNVLVHEYGEVKPSLVWRTVERDVPALLVELRRMLDE